jgi:hypothetical protein
MGRRLGPGIPADSHPGTGLQPSAASVVQRDHDPENQGFSLNSDQPATESPGNAEPATPSSAPSPPWHGEAGSRGGIDEPSAPPVEATPAPKPRRNLLFSSSSRKERERAQARAAADSSAPDLGAAFSPAAPQVPEPGEAPPATFDDAWPQSERARAGSVPPQRRSGRAPSTFTEPGAPAPHQYPQPARNEDPPPVTVLKSGVVDGMAYSLYSDGSIEAQMPEGMMRFASIDELRSHLDQRP